MTTKTTANNIRSNVNAMATECRIDISQALLAATMRRVIFASAPESSRYSLAGVRVEVSKASIVFVATDGRRLAFVELDAESDGEFAFFVPLAAARELSRMYASPKYVALHAVRIHGNQGASELVAVNWTNGRKKAKRTESKHDIGRFPKWRQIVDDACQTEAAIGWISGNSEALAAYFEPKTSVDVKVNGAVYMGREFLECEIRSQGKFEVSLAPELVVDWLQTLDSQESATLYVKSADSALYCESSGAGAHYIVMPLERRQPNRRKRRA